MGTFVYICSFNSAIFEDKEIYDKKGYMESTSASNMVSLMTFDMLYFLHIRGHNPGSLSSIALGGWEGPAGEIRGLSEQGRLMKSTFSATVRRCGNGRHAGGAPGKTYGQANRVEPEGPPTPSALDNRKQFSASL